MPTSALFRPRLLDCLRGYSRSDLRADVSAGVTLGIIALSLSMALGIASGATPAVGIVTGIVAGFLVSALGGSKVAIGGPTAAFIPVVAAVAQEHGADSLVICTALAGLMLMGLGFARMGAMIKYIPMPAVAGFTAGIAVYILSTQLRDFLGLQLQPGETVPADSSTSSPSSPATWVTSTGPPPCWPSWRRPWSSSGRPTGRAGCRRPWRPLSWARSP